MVRILVSWVGHTDLKAFAPSTDEDTRLAIAGIVKDMGPPVEGLGPLRSLLDSVRFDRIVILSNYPEAVTERFMSWLPVNAEHRLVSLADPTDYAEIFRIQDAVLKNVVGDTAKPGDIELFIHLSPGTPAMAAVWILLGKTRYPATFYQSNRGHVWETDIPFDLTVDVIPDLLRKPDALWQRLVAHAPAEVPGFEHISGNSQRIRLAVGRARKAAVRDVSVLILGESGTGKELFAQAIHSSSPRRNKPFVAVNCAAVPEPLLESELFGHVKGAFTGAYQDHQGAFERADGGTLFLDEIGECSPALQVKLLRVLEPPNSVSLGERTFLPVGAQDPRHADVRVVAATNKDLLQAVEEGAFRDDLLYRLAVITIKLPPLRQRLADIRLIADALLRDINHAFARNEPGYGHKSLSSDANAFLVQHSWPGNIRELRNCLLQAAVMSDAEKLTSADLEAAVSELPLRSRETANLLEYPLGNGFSIEKHLESIQRHYLQRAMREAHGVKTEAARLLGMVHYQTLDAQLKRMNVEWTQQ